MPAPSFLLAQLSAGGQPAKEATKKIRDAIRKAGGVVDDIADLLSVSRASVFRLLKRAELLEFAVEERRKSGARDRRNGAA